MNARPCALAPTDRDAAPSAPSPGIRTRTAALPPRRAAPVEAPAPVQRRATAVDAAFDFTADAPTVAARGVAEASAPLPHLAPIQRAFGRHDVRGVRAAVGGDAAASSAAMGALAYATGDRVGFAAEPDLHLAAHEAAHVVQQRGGVQLASGVGARGDRYEQHADRVADLVVAGCSAEAELDTLAAGGAATTAVQRHDSPTHVRAGDSVPGDSITVTKPEGTITFSPGELGALVDYVGDLAHLERFTFEQLQKMKGLLARGCEDVLEWQDATGGIYGDEAQKNEKHFAPTAGDGGENFRDQFITYFASALTQAQAAAGDPAAMGQAQLAAYTAEHYLEDAFSAGHQLAAKDIETTVAQHIGRINSRTAALTIGSAVWDAKQAEIQHYGISYGGLVTLPLMKVQFLEIATAGALIKGASGITDAVRRFVHEHLAELGVEVTSRAHPEPWTLTGDHGLAKDPIGVAAMQAALTEARALVKSVAPGADAKALATELFDRHCPTPTSGGRATVDDAIDEATASKDTILAAVIDTMCDTIEEVMDYAMMSLPTLRKLSDIYNAPHPFPDLGAEAPEAPVTGQPVGEPVEAPAPVTGQPVGEPGPAL